MRHELLLDFLEEVEASDSYDGYIYSIGQAITITVLGSLCGLKSIRQIHQWAESDAVRSLLKEKFAIERIPCYYWLLSLLKMVKTESLAQCLSKWAASYLPENRSEITLALDGKTVRSTEKMKQYESPLHIISAQLSELGITLGSRSVDGKSNEIPAVQKLLSELDIAGCLVVADALNCQKETAKAAIAGKADYLLSVKANQPALMQEIVEYVQDDDLRSQMDEQSTVEENRGRIEKRTAYVTTDISWMPEKGEWSKLCCIGAIHTAFTRGDMTTSQWHYYISSRPLTAAQLLYHARKEWSVETMHWLLDVHFDEDYFRVANQTIQKNTNMLRKFALSIIKQYKQNVVSKRPLSQIMFDCLLSSCNILRVLDKS